MEEFLKRIGYRFVLRHFTHDQEVAPGHALQFTSVWENIGVAPIYHPWPLAYRLRSDRGQIVTQWVSEADLKTWLPGSLYEVYERRTVPVDVPPGSYDLDVAILDQDRQSAHVYLAIEGGLEDRWYPISRVTVRR